MDPAETLLSALGEIPVRGGQDVSSKMDAPSKVEARPLSKRLQQWNGAIESEFVANIPSFSFVSEPNEDSLAKLAVAVETLHGHLVHTVLSNPPLFSGNKELSSGSESGIKDESDVARGGIVLLNDVEADATTSRAAEAVAECGAARTLEDVEDDNEKLILTSDLLRACKNILRWTNQRRALAMRVRGQSGPAEAEECVANDETKRLRQPGTLRLYLVLLEGCSSHFQKGSTVLTHRDSVAQTASLALFHATFGAGEPVADVARSVLVGSKVNFIPSLARLVNLPHPLPLLISLMRHVHSLVGSEPVLAKRLDSAVAEGSSDCKDKDLASVLVATLAWTLRSDPPFPGTDPGDRRSDLAVEVMRIMFVLQLRHASNNDEVKNDNDMMTQIGILICDILQLPNADFRIYDIKLAAVNLLMDCPAEYGQFLMSNNGIPPLLAVLTLQLTTVVVERTGSGAADAAAIVPILIALTRLSAANDDVKKVIKEGIFPPEAEKGFQSKAREEKEKLRGGDRGSVGGLGAKNMSPLDAPRGTVRWKLLRLMTWTESNVKRCASEFIWTLCNGDATEFVLRTGFGNAVHILGIKGLVTIPKESTVDIPMS
uniref:Uncharacterized protein n=1 Tax=Odontella aurita TaxID=265563 RepID=A0A7S4HXF2_9STRA